MNEFGFIESPYRKVSDGRVTDEIVYLAADDEEEYVIAQANAPIDAEGRFINPRVLVRRSPQAASLQDLRLQLEKEVFFGATTEISFVPPDEVKMMDISPKQIVSVATALIPFLEHDDANRALMGANMQRQAVPLVRSEAPYIGTGVERRAARDAADMVIATADGAVASIDGDHITVDYRESGPRNRAGLNKIRLRKFERSNQDTCISQRPASASRRRGQSRRRSRRRPIHRSGRVGVGQEPARGVHVLGGLQLRGRDHPLGALGA